RRSSLPLAAACSWARASALTPDESQNTVAVMSAVITSGDWPITAASRSLTSALVALPRRHVPADGAGRRAGRASAELVPAPRAGLPIPRAQLPRAAVSAGRAGRPVPGRAVRGARRADPGAGDAAERRAHLLHPRPGRRRGPR